MLAANRDVSIADYYRSGPGVAVWAPVFIRDAFVDDSTLSSFLTKLNEVTPHDSNDEVSWDLNSKGVFTIKSYYLKIISYSSYVIQSGSFGRFPRKIIWQNLAPLKVSVFV